MKGRSSLFILCGTACAERKYPVAVYISGMFFITYTVLRFLRRSPKTSNFVLLIFFSRIHRYLFLCLTKTVDARCRKVGLMYGSSYFSRTIKPVAGLMSCASVVMFVARVQLCSKSAAFSLFLTCINWRFCSHFEKNSPENENPCTSHSTPA